MPSWFLSSQEIRPVFSQLVIQLGASLCGVPVPAWSLTEGPLIVSIMLTRANAAIEGAVVYKIAMNNNAQPALLRASRTLGTVKKRTITCGKPAVPTISAAVIQNTSNVPFVPDVYSLNPSWVDNPSNLSSR